MPHDPSRMTVFATAMTSGVLLALAAHLLAGHLGAGLTSVWQDLFPTDAHAVRSAFGWWLIAGAGLAGSFLAGLLAQDGPDGGSARRRWRRGIGVLAFLLLAAAPFAAAAPAPPALALALGANLAALALALVTAFCGSWFALPR
jgi:hypothetical protein